MKIGVLTSGGDAPGMNAAVRAVCRSALNRGMEVVGIMRGYNGLLNGEIIEMNAKTVSGIIQRGGTCLYTARCNEFRNQEGVLKGKQKCEEMGLDGIVVIGGALLIFRQQVSLASVCPEQSTTISPAPIIQ